MLPAVADSPASGTPAPGYYPGINSLRALAILLVLFQHYVHYQVARPLSLGNAGVDIFFVISGFLITGNLLRYRERTTIANGLKIFFVRRMLRLMPLYYLYIAVAAYLTRDQLSPAAAGSLLFYYSNFFQMAGGVIPWPFKHFWSLAVEEQFYLMWPFVILLVPVSWLKWVIGAAIISGIAFGLLNTYVFFIYLGTYTHILSCMQALALGGLLSLLHHRRSTMIAALSQYGPVLLLISAAVFAVSAAWHRDYGWLYTLLRSSAAAFAAVAICMAIWPARGVDAGRARVFSALFRNRFLQYVGRISYGIYVFHILIMKLMEPGLIRLMHGETRLLPFAIVAPVIYTTVSIAVAYLSFRFFEAPFTRLKQNYTIG